MLDFLDGIGTPSCLFPKTFTFHIIYVDVKFSGYKQSSSSIADITPLCGLLVKMSMLVPALYFGRGRWDLTA